MKAGVINEVNYDYILDVVQRAIHSKIDAKRDFDRALDLFKETGVLIWSDGQKDAPVFKKFNNGVFSILIKDPLDSNFVGSIDNQQKFDNG